MIRHGALDSLRHRLGAAENDLIDELMTGRLARRDFLRHASRLGFALPFLGPLLGGLAAGEARAAGGTIRAALAMPAGAIDPVTIYDSASYQVLFQIAEYLCVTQPDLTLKPVLAESWAPNDDGSVWTFKLRRGVRFHDGREMTAEDVVATFDRLSDPKGESNALSVFKGLLSKGGTKKVDDYTVAFHLDAPNGNFPYAVSIDNYNAVILPADYKGDYEKSWIGTGPFKMESYKAKTSATLVRNDGYWGPKAVPDRVVLLFYGDLQPRLLALQAGEVDLLDGVPIDLSRSLAGNPKIEIIKVKTSAHRQLHMRCDTAPFTDKRVRQALALTLDRDKLVKGLCRGMATVGNDSPFAPIFPSTDSQVPQRRQDIRKAKALLAEARLSQGFEATLTTERYADIPDYAVLFQNFAKQIGVKINLNIETQDAYYGKAVFGQSDWLDSPLGITDYAHRGVPNVFLQAPLLGDGPWNAAHFKNATYDGLVARYVKALDIGAQRRVAGEIETLLLEETPVIISYFPDLLVPVRKGLTGLPPIPAGLLLAGVSLA